ncbi:GNAT family N-acetyltransferase [Novosphingobium sp.]|uniref:GNAT family N-acetyltransferase n=1 Tax=Novosphingobium sp. TaxID=1874826 RepID=UPI0025D4BA18|nr:GNAT family N-acetyltransferase [Novosphingobium sp.]
MTGHPLERPLWSCLTGPQARMARGGPLAWRLDPAFGPFAAAIDAGEEAQRALAALLEHDDDWMLVIERDPWPAPAGLREVETLRLVQMVRDAAPALAARPDAPPAALLGADDVPAMRALVAATEPGPWADSTHRFGDFFGIRDSGGDLVAMAGERFRPAAGLTELSGVCTAASARGQGLAARVIERVVDGMAARGETAFLHCRADNAGAIRLYRALGFTLSREMVATVLARG